MPVRFFPLKGFDLAQFASEAGDEGCAVLAGVERVIVGVRPTKKTSKIGETHGFQIGALAYPNVGLTNTIPEARFYSYDLPKSPGLQPPPFSRGLIRSSPLSLAFRVGHFTANISKKIYFQKIKKIKEYLTAGEVYQINFAIRFTAPFSGDPYGLFLALQQNNPADFGAYFNGGDFQIVSCSPERLFRLENGIIMTQPIKGTVRKFPISNPRSLPRTSFQFSNKIQTENLERLLASEKERAELDMITDLERNDLGKICEYGSILVKKERAILELPNMWHTYSEIQGRLRKDVGTREIFDALFPGGSVTGCPKIHAMRFISELEGAPRNIFTGSIGYVTNGGSDSRPDGGSDSGSNSGVADFNIAIRTVLIQNNQLEFWAGGGIVMDSDPEREYQECLLKAERIFDTIGQG